MSPERRRLFLGSGLIASGGLLYSTLSATGEAPVAAAAPAPHAQLVAPPPMTAAPTTAPVAAPDLSQLRLHGLTATGAIIATGTGQRLVRLGREVVPGATLEAVRQHHAVLATSAGRFELSFLGQAEAATPPSPGPASALGPVAASAGSTDRKTEVLQYRLGLAPRRSEGRINGYALRSGAEMPLLQRAGLRAGDVLVSVNGQSFDSDEKVMELATEIAGSYTAEFEFERNGRKMQALLPVNPRK